MTQTNSNEGVPFATLEVTELHDVELNAIEGGVFGCGEGHPHSLTPSIPIPPPRPSTHLYAL
jgi:hypothetical protein